MEGWALLLGFVLFGSTSVLGPVGPSFWTKLVRDPLLEEIVVLIVPIFCFVSKIRGLPHYRVTDYLNEGSRLTCCFFILILMFLLAI